MGRFITRVAPLMKDLDEPTDEALRELARNLQVDLKIYTEDTPKEYHASPEERLFSAPIVMLFRGKSAYILYTAEQARTIAEDPNVVASLFPAVSQYRSIQSAENMDSQRQSVVLRQTTQGLSKLCSSLASMAQGVLGGLNEFATSGSTEQLSKAISSFPKEQLRGVGDTVKSPAADELLKSLEDGRYLATPSKLQELSKRLAEHEKEEKKQNGTVKAPSSPAPGPQRVRKETCWFHNGVLLEQYEGLRLKGCGHLVCNTCLDTYYHQVVPAIGYYREGTGSASTMLFVQNAPRRLRRPEFGPSPESILLSSSSSLPMRMSRKNGTHLSRLTRHRRIRLQYPWLRKSRSGPRRQRRLLSSRSASTATRRPQS